MFVETNVMFYFIFYHNREIEKASNNSLIKPGGIYGKSGSLTALWFEGTIKRELFSIETKDVRWHLVHDYILMILISGQIFNIINNQSDSAEIKFKSPTNEFEEAMASTGFFSNKKAQTILGWNQCQLGFVDGITICWNSYKAYTQ
ncbi:hypothetical protein RhiirA1_448078 [Rhizophagus irregularis]|uniref:Uncharacterized protein n=1 Tax=Rhizophagus irregularis TaxID=588596 RepID=A0A2I1DU51_9GLOM|nr:hypothetical protein RhiirA1_448078 [Rhizophagus irregularis]PKY13379.1 hypothetical protein RhiirB3_425201 [Rhizophagus irregularis]